MLHSDSSLSCASSPPSHLTTLLVSQPNFADHQTPQGHPERADRIRAFAETWGTLLVAIAVLLARQGAAVYGCDLVYDLCCL